MGPGGFRRVPSLVVRFASASGATWLGHLTSYGRPDA
jgi:hypothetical protein